MHGAKRKRQYESAVPVVMQRHVDVRNGERFAVVFALSDLEHGHAGLDDVDLRSKCAGERQDLGLASPNACILHRRAVVQEVLCQAQSKCQPT